MQLPKLNTSKKKKPSDFKTYALNWLRHMQFHGVDRLAAGESRWFWIPSMLVLLIFAIILVYLTIVRYQENPTFMVTNESEETVLVFPSVLIYPEIKFSDFKKNEFLSTLKFPKSLNRTYIKQVLPQLGAFFANDVKYEDQDLENLEQLLQYNKIDLETAGRRLTTSCEETFIRCRWNFGYANCSELFRMELTADGFCCMFNGRSLVRELREKGQGHILVHGNKLYTNRFGFNSGLMVAVNQSQEHVNIDLSYKWIALQVGQRFADTSINGTALNPRSEQWAAFHVRSFRISDVARGLSLNLRKCRMGSEPLTYFPLYRRKYCILECEMARTINKCNCVRVVHPRPRGVPYCKATQLRCAKNAKMTVANADTCHCPSTCDVDTDFTKMSSFALNTAVRPVDKFYSGLDYHKVSIIRVFIQKGQRNIKQRWSFFTYVDLFSQLGGTFNMFFGCSILTMLAFLQLLWKLIATLWQGIVGKLSNKNNN